VSIAEGETGFSRQSAEKKKSIVDFRNGQPKLEKKKKPTVRIKERRFWLNSRTSLPYPARVWKNPGEREKHHEEAQGRQAFRAGRQCWIGGRGQKNGKDAVGLHRIATRTRNKGIISVPRKKRVREAIQGNKRNVSEVKTPSCKNIGKNPARNQAGGGKQGNSVVTRDRRHRGIEEDRGSRIDELRSKGKHSHRVGMPPEGNGDSKIEGETEVAGGESC